MDHPLAVIQVGGLMSKKHATKLIIDLKRRGYKPVLVRKPDIHNNGLWYSVQIGYFSDNEEAGLAALSFAEKEEYPTKVP